MELQFPFTHMNPASVVFGIFSADHFEKVVADCPIEFKATANEWNAAARKIFFKDLKELDLKKMIFITDDLEVARGQFANFQAWMANRRLDQEDKKAICGWLLSLMLKAPPVFD